MFRLDALKEFIEKYVKIITEMVEVDVEIVDYKLRRITGSGIFTKGILDNKQVSNRRIFIETLKTGKPQISIANVDIDKAENIEITTPIILGTNVIGVIGMISSSKKSKVEIGKHVEKYKELLEQIAEFITLKALEYEEDKDKQAMVSMLEIIIRNMDEGAVIINNEGKINTINRSAKKQLKINRIIANERILIQPTGDMVNNNKEYVIRIGENINTVIGNIFKVPENPIYDKVLLFRDMKQVQSNLYAMTSTISAKKIENIIGKSKKTLNLKKSLVKIAKSDSTVLVNGESGTGKEMVAAAIWQSSDRANKRFVTINCAAIPEDALERELFGYVKGVFSGDNSNGKIGKFELANNGVIFLDEIDAVPLYLQSKLLRVIQDKKVTRIGSNQVIPLNIRIIAATNKDLRKLIAENKFREDLYYRLNVIPLYISPLRERKEDIEELIYYFLDYYRKQFSKNFYKIEDDALDILKNYSWPGNVRELENSVEYMVNMMEDGIISVNSIPKNIIGINEKRKIEEMKISTLASLEKKEIEKAIEIYGDTTEGKKKAAKALGIGIATLYRKL
ncbi:MAG TPA: sigma 54-interacting transcriptional regulator [Gallicola sp.]|nr:sigma 54-interacting transcriptional regulator [Gallicola sp.]